MDLQRVLIGLFGVWLAWLPIQTARRVPAFRTGETLWRAAVRVNPDMPRARMNLADAIWKTTQDAEATTDQLLIARTLLPDAPLAPHRQQGYTFLVHAELGMLAAKAGHPDEAQRYFLAAAATDPRLVRFLR